MFKRVEKRLKRKEREDELGLDEDMKDVLGLNDTDSDESESDSDSDSHGDIADADSGDDEVEAEEVDFDEGDDEEEEEEEEESDNEVNQQSDERALITIAEALTNPIFLVSLDPTVNECIVCPGKQLKNQNMVETHTSSKAHERRFKQFKDLASGADVKAIAQDLIEKNMSSKQVQLSTDPGTSKRAEKKRISQEKRKAKREKFKARQKAKKEALAPGSSDPATKKGEPSNKAEKSVGKEIPEGEEKHVSKDDGGKPKKRKKKSDTALGVPKSSQPHTTDPPASPPKKKHKTSRSTDATRIPITTPATNSTPSARNLKTGPNAPKSEKKVSEDGREQRKKRKNKNDNTSEILIPSKHVISNPPPSPPNKKRKLSSSTTKPSATNQKSKSAPTTAPEPIVESPKVISELQAQVKDIIKSASGLAKAARARALNGGDSGDETKPSTTKKMKKKAVKTKKVQES